MPPSMVGKHDKRKHLLPQEFRPRERQMQEISRDRGGVKVSFHDDDKSPALEVFHAIHLLA